MFNRVRAGLSAAMIAFAKASPVLARDLAGIGAVVMISYGAWLVYAPAGYIVGGVLVLAGTMLTARN